MIIGISDPTLFKEDALYVNRLVDLMNSDLDYLILRGHTNSDALIALILTLLEGSEQTARKLVVHHQVEVARHLGIKFVHLPERRIDQPRKAHTVYSYSVHTLESIEKLGMGDAKFALFSPIFSTACKPGALPLVEPVIKKALALTKVPLVALGGINSGNAHLVKEMGFEHIALRSALMTCEDVTSEIALYKSLGF